MDLLKNLNFNGKTAIGLNQILQGIRAAAEDENIKGIYLDVSELQAGIAIIEELRGALLAFRESGKFIISYADSYGQGAYYLASVADKMYLHPIGNIDWRGLGAHILFYKGAMQKLGIEPEIFRHGKFKGAVEPFMLDKMSDENRTQILTYAGGIWQHWLSGVEKQRKIAVKKQHEVASGLLLKNANACIALGFADDLRYKDQVITELAVLTHQPEDKPKMLGIADYASTVKQPHEKSNNKLAILYAEGDIVDGSDGGFGSEGGIVGSKLAGEIKQLRKDSSVKAVVLRINSPGGSAFASDVIWREVDLLRQTKPVVVSMGNYAASGGYYIACAASKIVANPTTITGSIGVFGLMFNVSKLSKDKLGITSDVALTEPNADLYNIFRPMPPIQKAYIQNGVEDIYGTFISHVAAGRGMTAASVDAIAQGRVWNGIDAKRLKLVDEIGGLQDAIDIAADLANLTDYTTREYPQSKGNMEMILKFLEGSVRIFSSPAEQLQKEFIQKLHLQHGTVQARLPYDEDFDI
jgi:protease-4